MAFYFYLARCHNQALYAGYCKDLTQREAAHNNGTGAKYTRAHGPVKIVYSESFNSKSDAMKREYEVKQWPKNKKEALLFTHQSKPTPKH